MADAGGPTAGEGGAPAPFPPPLPAAAAAPVREDQVQNAVTFLTHPKVGQGWNPGARGSATHLHLQNPANPVIMQT